METPYNFKLVNFIVLFWIVGGCRKFTAASLQRRWQQEILGAKKELCVQQYALLGRISTPQRLRSRSPHDNMQE
jgi:hypothetical protein